MANEANIITLLGNQGDVVEWTVDSATAIPKGSLMIVSASPKTAVKSSTSTAEIFAGISAVEKSATDTTIVKMPCITHCIAHVWTTAGDSVVLGAPVALSNVANCVETASVDTIEHATRVVGRGLETVTNTADQLAVHVNVGRKI